jgi:hypothetical protein
MTNRRRASFIDALVAGRRPGSFKADLDDVDVLRTAIALRAARPGDDIPDEAFVSNLFATLAHETGSPAPSNVRVLKKRPVRTTLGAVAASLVLVGGTVAVTETANHAGVTTATVQVPKGTALRTGTFLTADNQVVGQIVAYRGHPSWVYMDIGGSNYNGRITCMLHVEDGSTVAVGNFDLHRGTGEFSRTTRIDISRLRGAKLVTPTGSVVASATFA